MKLLTKAIEKKLPRYEELGDEPIAQVKFFDPTGSWTWYAVSYEPETKIFYGLVEGFETEFGDFSLTELESYKGRFGLGIERDLWFEPTKVSELVK